MEKRLRKGQRLNKLTSLWTPGYVPQATRGERNLAGILTGEGKIGSAHLKVPNLKMKDLRNSQQVRRYDSTELVGVRHQKKSQRLCNRSQNPILTLNQHSDAWSEDFNSGFHIH